MSNWPTRDDYREKGRLARMKGAPRPYYRKPALLIPQAAWRLRAFIEGWDDEDAHIRTNTQPRK